MWLILDVASSESDIALAHHVLHVHREGKPPELSFTPIASAELRAYIAHARSFEPCKPVELSDYISVRVRGDAPGRDRAGRKGDGVHGRRATLLSILRLSEALARLRWADVVIEDDVNEALRLMKMSKVSLEDTLQDEGPKVDPITAVYMAIRDWADARGTSEVSYERATALLEQGAQRRGAGRVPGRAPVSTCGFSITSEHHVRVKRVRRGRLSYSVDDYFSETTAALSRTCCARTCP